MGVVQTSGEKKKIIIDLLLKSDMVRKLINPQPNDLLDETEILLGGDWVIDGDIVSEQGHIFDYNFVDDTITDSKVFIFVETDIPTMTNSNRFAEFNLYVSIFADKSLIRLSQTSCPTKQEMKNIGFEGNRIDILCGVVDDLLNGRDVKGVGNLQPATMGFVKMYQPNKQFYGKVLTYKVKGFNDGGDRCDLQ